MAVLQASEKRVFTLFQQKTGEICSRDEIAAALWGSEWPQKYSNWMIDTLIYRLRRKLAPNLEIKTIRNQGYVLQKKGYRMEGSDPSILLLKPTSGVQATTEYLNYMNNPHNLRRSLVDLFNAAAAGLKKHLTGRLLVINSFSFDNVDALKNWSGEVIMTHYDERALALHRSRVEELNLTAKIQTVYDDIRASRFNSQVFDIIINDFRFNFNLTHQQNQRMAQEMRRILKPGGKAFVSAVVGERKRWFEAAEHLPRICFTKEYYLKLFKTAGFKIVKEFDTQAGRSWAKTIATRPGLEPTYCRWLLRLD